jgi:hypothetical protein
MIQSYHGFDRGASEILELSVKGFGEPVWYVKTNMSPQNASMHLSRPDARTRYYITTDQPRPARCIAVDNCFRFRLNRQAMHSRPRVAHFGILAFFAFSFIGGCEEKSACTTICVRVAECRREVPDDEKMLGGKTPHADPKCKERCESNPEGFAACEAKKKLCSDLVACTGRF